MVEAEILAMGVDAIKRAIAKHIGLPEEIVRSTVSDHAFLAAVYQYIKNNPSPVFETIEKTK